MEILIPHGSAFIFGIVSYRKHFESTCMYSLTWFWHSGVVFMTALMIESNSGFQGFLQLLWCTYSPKACKVK